jgi:hypothetical protein
MIRFGHGLFWLWDETSCSQYDTCPNGQVGQKVNVEPCVL